MDYSYHHDIPYNGERYLRTRVKKKGEKTPLFSPLPSLKMGIVPQTLIVAFKNCGFLVFTINANVLAPIIRPLLAVIMQTKNVC